MGARHIQKATVGAAAAGVLNEAEVGGGEGRQVTDSESSGPAFALVGVALRQDPPHPVGVEPYAVVPAKQDLGVRSREDSPNALDDATFGGTLLALRPFVDRALEVLAIRSDAGISSTATRRIVKCHLARRAIGFDCGIEAVLQHLSDNGLGVPVPLAMARFRKP